MELFTKIVHSFQSFIFTKVSILDVWQVLNAPVYITNGIYCIMNNIWKNFDADIKTEFK